MIRRTLVGGLIAAALSAFAGSQLHAANDHVEPMKRIGKERVAAWLADPTVVEAVKKQNAKHASLRQQQIDELDRAWRAEVKSGGGRLIRSVTSNPLSALLKRIKADSQGLFTEIFVMDNKGLNVGQSDVTSDYWQGDEAKWRKTFQVGPGAVHVSGITTDESTQTLQSQLSMTVVDPASGEVIGAVTVGVNVEMLGQ